MNHNPSTKQAGLNGYLGGTLDDIANAASNAVSGSISSIINNQIDKLAVQIRVKLAAEQTIATGQQVDPNSIPDLDVTEYIIGMPTGSTNKVLDEKLTYIGASVRNGLIIGFGMIAVAMIITKLSHKHEESYHA